MFAGFTAFTWFHTVISLIMLLAGTVVTFGMIGGRRHEGWIALYLITAVLTNATGFGFLPIEKLLPSHILAILSLVLLAVALAARYVFAGMVVVTAFFDYFGLVVQLFPKVPGLPMPAPTPAEPPFAIVQGV